MMMQAIGLNQKILVICVRWSDVDTTRMIGKQWVSLLTSQINEFYNRATFNKTNFVFKLPTKLPTKRSKRSRGSWYDLGYARSGYKFEKTGQDAINLVDSKVDFADYNGVLVITNNPDFGGQGKHDLWWKTTKGIEATFKEGKVYVGKRQMGLAIINEWEASHFGMPYDEAAAVAAHEIGHQINSPTHYSTIGGLPGISRDSISFWDVMGLSPFQHHFLGWTKERQGWLPEFRVQTVKVPGPDRDVTITLSPLERDKGAVQLIKIPFFENELVTRSGTIVFPFVGYFVENRQRVNGDEGLPSSGVLVTMVNENPDTFYGSKAIIMDKNPSTGTLDDAALQVGDTYSDVARNISISVVNQTGDNYDVRVKYKSPPSSRPNLMITPWGAPPYTSPDIWVDSEKNGWGIYRYTDGGGNPSGQGDVAWVDHTNRIYVRIYNLGPGLATNVRVQITINYPPGMGDAGPYWLPVGTILFPSIAAGDSAMDFVQWEPTVGAHTSIRAVIEEVPGELGTANHSAQMNVTLFETGNMLDTPIKRRLKPMSLKIPVYNPKNNTKTPVFFNVHDIPKNWAVEITPRQLMIKPGGHKWVKFSVYPSGALKTLKTDNEGNVQYQAGFIGKPKIEAYIPFTDTFVSIGGIELWAHLIITTKLTCIPKRIRNRITVTGQLLPRLSDATIAIELTSKRRRLLQHAKTDQDGKYFASFQVLNKRIWNVQAFFDGDMIHGATQSD